MKASRADNRKGRFRPVAVRLGRFLLKPGRREVAFAFLLFLVTGAVYRAAPVYQMYDSRYLTAVSHSLIKEGNLQVAPSLPIRESYQLKRVGDRAYHFFPNAPAVLNTPFVLVYDLVGIPVFDSEGSFQTENEIRILRTCAAIVTAATVALSFLLARIYLTEVWSLALALLFGFGTQLFSVSSRAYWSHTWGVFLLTLALYLLLSPVLASRRWSYLLAGSALAWACFCRPTFAFSALGLTLFCATRARRRFLPYLVLAGAVWAGLFVVHSLVVYEIFLPPYFYTSQIAKSRLSFGRLWDLHRVGLLGTLFSPGRGLFLFTPILGLVLYAVLRHWRRLDSRFLAGMGLVIVMGHWQLISSFRNWWGGGSYGPRLFTDVLPWFFVLAVLGVAAIGEAAGGRGKRIGILHGSAWVLAAFFAVFVHTRGAISRDTFHFGVEEVSFAPLEVRRDAFSQERLWNWRYPQFLGGLIPTPPMRPVLNRACSGDEELVVRCDRKGVRAMVYGAPGSRYSMRATRGSERSGQLPEEGPGVDYFPRIRKGNGYVTAVWDCGTAISRAYECPPRPER